MNVAVFGVGKLGSCLVAVLAEAGYDVVGVDVNQEFIDKLNKALPPVDETGLPAYLSRNCQRIHATTDAQWAAAWADIIMIVVPTPSLSDHRFSNQYAVRACQSLAPGLDESKYRLVVMVSTVMPGSMEGVIIPSLEAIAGSSGPKYGVCYNPEFIALGSVIQNMRRPDFVLIGQSDDKAGFSLMAFYESLFCRLNEMIPTIARLSLVNAEIAKLAVNTYVTTKISFANMLGDLCERIAGADATKVCNAIGLDSRIGHKYLTPAGAFGGPCFPRDTRALRKLALDLGYDVPLVTATEKINNNRVGHVLNLVMQHEPQKVAILGLSYKPYTHITEESFGLELARALATVVDVHVWDSQACITDAALKQNTLDKVLADADVVVVTTAWPELADVDRKLFKPGCHIYDCWGLLTKVTGCTVSRIGANS